MIELMWALLTADADESRHQKFPNYSSVSMQRDAVPAPAVNMKMVFEDSFEGTKLDLGKWYPGPKPTGPNLPSGQWGGAYFIDMQGDAKFDDAYHVENGVLRLRARHSEAYDDPQRYGRKWYGAEVSTAFPDGTTSGAIRRGYFEARMKLPSGEGAWAAWWLLNVSGILKNQEHIGDVEIDILESYGQWVRNGGYLITIHDFGASGDQFKQAHSDILTKNYDLSDAFHNYGCLITDNEIVMYFDEKELARFPLPKSSIVDKFFAILSMSIDNDPSRKVVVPKSGHYDLLIDHVKIYSAD